MTKKNGQSAVIKIKLKLYGFFKVDIFCMNYLLVVVQHCVDKATEILFQVELRKIIFEKYEQTNLLQKN